MLPEVDYNLNMNHPLNIVPFLTLFLAASAFGEDLSLLSPEKQSYYEHQRQQIDSGYEKLRYEWLSPINLKATDIYEKSAIGSEDTRQSVSAGIAQDLFRSGGITYSIDYAEAKKEADSIGMGKEIATLNQQLYSAVLNYRKNALLLEQSELKLKNTKIEIFLKRKQYEAGDIDITLLNNALMNQSNELKNNTSLRYALAQQKYEAAKLSDHPIEQISLPTFTLTEKETFLQEGWEINYLRSQSQSSIYQYGLTKSSYLPKLTLNADVGLQRYDSQSLSSADYRGNYYDMGLVLTLPLAYNASSAIQEAQSTYLKQQADTADRKRQMDAQYEQSVSRIESYRRTIAITRDNLTFYDELIRTTKAAVDAGYKAGYDLQTLQNTKAIEELEIKINEINMQIELSSLHSMMRHSQEKSL